MVDSTTPGYAERRLLKERIIEKEEIPVSKPPSLEPALILPLQPAINIPEEEDKAKGHRSLRPPPHSNQSEVTVGSGHWRKGSRRRVVDLARDESPQIHQKSSNTQAQREITRPSIVSCPSDGFTMLKPILLPPLQLQSETLLLQPYNKDSSHYIEAEVSDKGRSLATEIQSLNLHGDAYRQKVEALKSEVGSNWLSVLSEEGWNEYQRTEDQDTRYGVMRPDPQAFQAASKAIVSGSQTTL